MAVADEGSRKDLDVHSLLQIDVAAELRKLAQAQLQGSWQVGAELVRRSIGAGAQRVEVETSRGRLVARDDGGMLSRQVLEDLAALLDERAEPDRRHLALTRLEQGGFVALLAIAGLELRSVRIQTAVHEGGLLLQISSEGTATLRRFEPPCSPGTEIELNGLRFDRAKTRSWIADVCRFAPVDVMLDGRALTPGLEHSMARAVLSEPLRGEVSIPPSGEVARVWLLMHGVVSTHVTVTSTPAFDAAVEMSGLVAPLATAADLRESLERRLDLLLDQVAGILISLGGRLGELDPALRRRILQQLLRAAGRLRTKQIAALPIIPCHDAHGEMRLVSMVEMREQAGRGDGSVPVLLPSQDPRDFAIAERVFVLEEHERAMLAELLELRFVTPRPAARRRGLGSRVRERIGRWRRGLWSRAVGLIHPARPIEESGMRGPERAAVRELARALGPEGPRPVLCHGAGPVREVRAELLMPRDNPQVQAALAGIARDPSWAYPAALALAAGERSPTRTARDQWLAARAPRTAQTPRG